MTMRKAVVEESEQDCQSISAQRRVSGPSHNEKMMMDIEVLVMEKEELEKKCKDLSNQNMAMEGELRTSREESGRLRAQLKELGRRSEVSAERLRQIEMRYQEAEDEIIHGNCKNQELEMTNR
jgi:predicted RNase H-like nuclease (RuvC/YqgF family)